MGFIVWIDQIGFIIDAIQINGTGIYNTFIPAWKVKSEKRWHLQIFEVESTWKWGGLQVKPQSFTSKANQREAWHWSDLRCIFTSKRGGIFAKIRCAFQIITLKESSISNTLYILGVNLFSLFSICQLKKVTKHIESHYDLCQVIFLKRLEEFGHK